MLSCDIKKIIQLSQPVITLGFFLFDQDKSESFSHRLTQNIFVVFYGKSRLLLVVTPCHSVPMNAIREKVLVESKPDEVK